MHHHFLKALKKLDSKSEIMTFRRTGILAFRARCAVMSNSEESQSIILV